jgi:hypothetical protein
MVTVVQLFQEQLAKFAGHRFRIHHQYQEIRKVRTNCGDNDLVLHIDFSENYAEQYAREVQAMHYGNRQQIVLHQGIAYRKVI